MLQKYVSDFTGHECYKEVSLIQGSRIEGFHCMYGYSEVPVSFSVTCSKGSTKKTLEEDSMYVQILLWWTEQN